jgi:hypothetical protein
MQTQATPFATTDEAAAYGNSVLDRFHYGDLGVFADCVYGYANADIRVECHVQYIPADTSSVRLCAYRVGELGFFGAQRPDADMIDVYRLSPYELSAAVCDELPLTQPGRRSRIIVPEYAPKPRNAFDTGDFVIHHASEAPAEVTIPASEVSVYSTVQSHWLPTRRWGFDGRKSSVVWIRVIDDGDYIYARDFSHAVPMTGPPLHRRIDELIAEDIAILREFRRDH